MDERLVAFAVPVFFLAMLVEWLLNRRHLRQRGVTSPTGGEGGYRLVDTITDLGTGIGQQALDPLFRVLQVGAYLWVWNTVGFGHAFWDLTSPAHWLLALVLVDHSFYWFHRVSHRSNVFWAVHHVHHSSEEYNLAVALRQPWLEKLVDLPFYLPLAALGMPVEMYLGAFTIDLLYQFFIHTRWVPKLGPLEWILNTPSHHRVHHGVNPAYIDRNYGGVLIVFDRLFGTFTLEREEPVYGTVKLLASWSPLTANLHVWQAMWDVARRTARWSDKLWIWLAPPEWLPADQGGPVTIPEPNPKERGWNPPTTPEARAFAVVAFFLLVGQLLAFLWRQRELTLAQQALFAVLAVGLMVGWSAGLENRGWAKPTALASVLAFGVGFPLLVGWSGPALLVPAAVAALGAVLALRVRTLPLATA